MGDTSDREIGGAGPALCVKPAKEEAKLGSPPPLAGCSPCLSVSGSGPGSMAGVTRAGASSGEARLPPVCGGQAVSRQLGSYPPLTNQGTSGQQQLLKEKKKSFTFR